MTRHPTGCCGAVSTQKTLACMHAPAKLVAQTDATRSKQAHGLAVQHGARTKPHGSPTPEKQSINVAYLKPSLGVLDGHIAKVVLGHKSTNTLSQFDEQAERLDSSDFSLHQGPGNEVLVAQDGGRENGWT